MADPLANQDDDIQLQGYQDDVDTSGKTDDVTHSMTDNAAEDYGIPESEMKEELNNRAVEDEGNDPTNNEARFDSDDALNDIEDRDEDVTNEN